jgi:hypothetical protein
MATRAKKFDMSNVLYSAAGGVGGVLATNAIKKIKFFQDKPKAAPLATAAMGAGLMYFGNDTLQKIGGGIVAVSGASLASELLAGMAAKNDEAANGMSRVNLQGADMDAAEYAELIAELRDNAPIVEMMEQYEDEDEDEDEDSGDNM